MNIYKSKDRNGATIDVEMVEGYLRFRSGCDLDASELQNITDAFAVATNEQERRKHAINKVELRTDETIALCSESGSEEILTVRSAQALYESLHSAIDEAWGEKYQSIEHGLTISEAKMLQYALGKSLDVVYDAEEIGVEPDWNQSFEIKEDGVYRRAGDKLEMIATPPVDDDE